MTRNQELKCVSEHKQMLYEPEKVKVQVDPLGMTKYMIASAQEAAWKFGWLEARNYDAEDFCDRIYEMSVFRRRHGCQMSQFASKNEKNPTVLTEPIICVFNQMSVNKIFTPCPLPADENSIFCKAHKDEHVRLTLQAGRKLITIAWEQNMYPLTLRGFLKEMKRVEFKGDTKAYNSKITKEWQDDVAIIMKGQEMLDSQDQRWALNSKTGKYFELKVKLYS